MTSPGLQAMHIQHKVVEVQRIIQMSIWGGSWQKESVASPVTYHRVPSSSWASKVFTKIPVSFWPRSNPRGVPPTANFHIVIFVGSDRNAVSWDISGRVVRYPVNLASISPLLSIQGFLTSFAIDFAWQQSWCHTPIFLLCLKPSNLKQKLCLSLLRVFKSFDQSHDVTSISLHNPHIR